MGYEIRFWIQSEGQISSIPCLCLSKKIDECEQVWPHVHLTFQVHVWAFIFGVWGLCYNFVVECHAHVWVFVNFNKCSNFVVKCELLQRKGAWWMFDENVEWPTPEVRQVEINTIWNRHFELLFIDVTSNRIQIWEITIVILLIYLTFCHSYKRQTSKVLFGL
jgi:hypothetical protein